MKKLITGAVAAIAILLGFAACSGEYSKDLLDNDVQPLYIVGIQPDNGRKALTIVDSTTQELKFTYKYNSGNLDLTTGYEFDAWSSKEGVIAFKICRDADLNTWRDWGGINNNNDGAYTADVAPKPKINSSKFITLNYRGTTLAPSNPGNVYIYDLVDETEYTLTVKYISSSNSVSLKISTEGSVAEMPEMTLVPVGETKTFPTKDEDKNDIIYTMNRAGTTYTYNFIATDDETISFRLESLLANTIWGNARLELDQDNGKKSNEMDLTMGVESDGISNISIAVEKNVKYKITVNASKGLSKTTIIAEKIDCIEAGKAGVYGNYIYSDAFYTQATASAGVSFKSTSDTFKFKILRDTTADYPVWGSNGAKLELGYTYKPVYYAEEKSASDLDYMTITGLEPGKSYRLQIENKVSPEDMIFKIVKISEDYHWFWKNVKISEGATPIFYSSSTGYQTDNMDKFLGSKRTLVMKWLADGSKDNAVELTEKDKNIPSDCPYSELEEQDGYVRMFVYANVDAMNIYTWGPELYGNWDNAMQEGAFDTNWEKPDVTYNVTVSISGLKPREPIVFVGNVYGWTTPFLSWAENDTTKAKENAKNSKIAVADENGIATLKDYKYTSKGSTMPVVICTMKDVPTNANISDLESFVGGECDVQTNDFNIVLDKENVDITLKFNGTKNLSK